jgi:hypothetical protein
MRHQPANPAKTAGANREKSAKISTGQSSVAGAPIHPVLQLQRAIGNRAVQRWVRTLSREPEITEPIDSSNTS